MNASAARILTVQIRRRVDPQQLALFAQPAPCDSSDCKSATVVEPLHSNPYRRRVLRMREAWAADAARRAGAQA